MCECGGAGDLRVGVVVDEGVGVGVGCCESESGTETGMREWESPPSPP